MQRLHVRWIQRNLTLQQLNFEEDNTRFCGSNERLLVKKNSYKVKKAIESGFAYRIFGLNESLQMTSHRNTTKEPFKRTQLWTGNFFLWMRARATQRIECLVSYQRWYGPSPRSGW